MYSTKEISVCLVMADGVASATDLIRLEIALWDHLDVRLRASHELTEETIHFIAEVERVAARASLCLC
jgi:hypothetical protein